MKNFEGKNRRHNSYLNVNKTTTLLNLDNFNANNINNSHNNSRMYLRSNSLFAYQEFDHFSSLCDTQSKPETDKTITNSDNWSETFEMQDSFSFSLSGSDLSPKKTKTEKRMSSGNAYNVYSLNNINNQQPNFSQNFNDKKSNFRRSSANEYPSPSFYLRYLNQQRMIPPFQIIPSPNLTEDQLILSNLPNLLKDNKQCRMIQNKLEEKKGNYEFVKIFYDRIEEIILDIMNDKFGNYVVQKFIEVVIDMKYNQLFNDYFCRIQKDFYALAINNYGTRVVQKMLEKLEGQKLFLDNNLLEETFSKVLQIYYYKLIYDKNGNHVFQKIIRIFPKEKNDFIFLKILTSAIEVSKLKQGVSLLETFFSFCYDNQKNAIIEKILEEMGALIEDEYGNFTIQFVIDLKEEKYNKKIFDYIQSNLVKLSKNKFASNVLDKMIVQENDFSLQLIDMIIEKKLVEELIIDQFGNYLIQKALNVSNGNRFMKIVNVR